jgi:hypothetical protein
VHCSWPVCVQVWKRVVVAAAATSRFQFWLGLSLGYGLDSLINSCYSFLVCYPWRKVHHLCLGMESIENPMDPRTKEKHEEEHEDSKREIKSITTSHCIKNQKTTSLT